MTDEPSVIVDDPAAPTLPAEAPPDLALVVGAAPRKPTEADDPDAPDDPKKSKRPWILGGIGVAAALVVGGLIFLGHVNAQTYAFTCQPDKIVAEQGRAFPPWGTRPLTDPEWKPVDITPRFACVSTETDDRGKLASWFADALYDNAAEELTPSPGHEVTKLDLAEQQIDQALLLLRTATEAKHGREQTEHWLANVTFWRTKAKLRESIAGLGELANQFDQAAKAGPHQITNAHAWAEYVRKVAAELKLDQPEASTANAPPPPEERPGAPAPMGTALPVEPTRPAEALPAPPPDAGVPSGGVML